MRSAEDIKKQKEVIAAQNRTIATEKLRLSGAVDEVLKTESGRLVFIELFNICGYNRNDLALNSGTKTLDVQSSLYNMARRSVYIELRELATPELVRAAEALAEQQTIAVENKSEEDQS